MILMQGSVYGFQLELTLWYLKEFNYDSINQTLHSEDVSVRLTKCNIRQQYSVPNSVIASEQEDFSTYSSTEYEKKFKVILSEMIA